MPRRVSVHGKKPRGLEGEHAERIRNLAHAALRKPIEEHFTKKKKTDRHYLPPSTDNKRAYTRVETVEHVRLITQFITRQQMPLWRLVQTMKELSAEGKIPRITQQRVHKLYTRISLDVAAHFEKTKHTRFTMMVNSLEEVIFTAQNGTRDDKGNYVVKPDLRLALQAMDQLSELTGLYPKQDRNGPTVHVNVSQNAGSFSSAPEGVQQGALQRYLADNASNTNVVDAEFEEVPVALVR